MDYLIFCFEMNVFIFNLKKYFTTWPPVLSSMNLLGFTVTVRHTGQRDPHISKKNDKQLAQNMYGVQHFVWTG